MSLSLRVEVAQVASCLSALNPQLFYGGVLFLGHKFLPYSGSTIEVAFTGKYHCQLSLRQKVCAHSMTKDQGFRIRFWPGLTIKTVKKPQRLCKSSTIWHLTRRGPGNVSVGDRTMRSFLSFRRFFL